MARAENIKCFHVLSAVALLLIACSAVNDTCFVYPVSPIMHHDGKEEYEKANKTAEGCQELCQVCD